ncbi:AAA domain-containing protein [Paenibacillus monticola]|uniref:AAA family ATPase n=1 Tax=Paenibacillus monticola TaxID=2666075 RepID=A0A7X2HBI3_9BACL|nr:AAA domain-containing protein [Paenibacillus monticola]MRN56358.1 AAA family ATPase [Paenibacillus monticola]
METSEDQRSTAKQKLIQVFSYLQAMHQLKQPVIKRISGHLWSQSFSDVPVHSHIICDFVAGISPSERIEELIPDVLLTVKRPDPTPCPKPPELLKRWLKPDWEKIQTQPDRVESLESYREQEDSEEYEAYQERFDQDEERVRIWEEWIQEREAWKQNEWPVRRTIKLFEDLYMLYSWIDRERDAVELMIGDGILHWELQQETIHHPVLLQKVQLLFNPDVPEFMLIASEDEPEFHSPLFRDTLEVSAQSLKKCADDLLEVPCSPLGYEDTDNYLKKVSSYLSAKALFMPYGSDAAALTQENKAVYIRREPVIFLRKRAVGFDHAIEEIIKDLNEREDFPQAIARITGIDTGAAPQGENAFSYSNLNVNGENEEILFTKEANSEQLDIALKLGRFGSVLVQGPPGTGKTHTIANLLGHFLAEGKSVLVTSHTSRALAVLRDKVAEPLQNLCVSVLDDVSGQKQLENSIDIITSTLSSISLEQSEQEIAVLSAKRQAILEQIKEINNNLRISRESDYRLIVLWGSEFDPSRAAKMISAGQKKMDFIPGKIVAGHAFPLTPSELDSLYLSSGEITPADENEFKFVSITAEMLITPEEFNGLVQEHQELLRVDKNKHIPYWTTNLDVQPDKLFTALIQLRQTMAISNPEDWKLELIFIKEHEKNDWLELLEEVEAWLALYRTARTARYKYGFEHLTESDLQPLSPVLNEIKRYLENGGKLNSLQLLLKRQWKKVCELIAPPGTDIAELDIAYLDALLAVIDYQTQRSKSMTRWKRQVTDRGGYDLAEFGSQPEEYMENIQKEIRGLLDWRHSSFNPSLEVLENEGFLWSELVNSKPLPLGKHAEWFHLQELVEQELPDIIHSYVHAERWRVVNSRIQEVEQTAQSLAEPRSLILSRLQESIVQLDQQLYGESYRALQQLWEKSTLIIQRQEWLEQLQEGAPDWAQAVRNRSGIHGELHAPSEAQAIWLLKQLDMELDQRAAISTQQLQEELVEIRKQFKSVTLQLVEKKAWLALAGKTTLKQQNALHGWKLLMKKAGKRTGKSAPHLLAEARKLMPICQTAVPVWIMPTYRVVDSFNPSENHFDVVIVDEASQADIMALTALYLGTQIVVVGDDEQVSPEAIGQRLEETRRLMDTHLEGIPNAALYDGSTSIYDLAKTSFAGMTQLREHFRCVEPIIQFSNSLSYNGSILPLRDASGVPTKPYTVEYRVESGSRNNKRNEAEAQAVASLILSAIEQEEYKDATFGVITLLGEEQAILIDQYLQKHIPATEYKRRKIRCGNSAQFQGDERDIIFLSMVDASEESVPLRLISDPGNRTKKRYNVAVSRARDQLWLVHSLDSSTQLKEGDLRKRLIEYVRNPYAADEALKQHEPALESEFERQVMRRVLQEGYRVLPQWKVGAYRIDMVIEGGGKRLAVECDGDKWHPVEKLREDLDRQSILERLGWTFVRIRGGEFFRHPDRALLPLFRKLEELNIPRELHQQEKDMMAGESEPAVLKDAIVNRAARIRLEWQELDKEPAAAASTPEDSAEEDTEEFFFREISLEPNLTYYWTEEMRNTEEERQAIFEQELLVLDTAAGMEVHYWSDSQTTGGPEISVDSGFELTVYLEAQGLKFLDLRDQDGMVWVIEDLKLVRHLSFLRQRGVTFTYLKEGTYDTHWRAAWYSRYREISIL